MLPEIARALMRRASGLWRNDRAREAMIVLRGTHELAMANGLVDVHRASRTQLTFYEQFDDPVAGLAMAREGLELAARQGSALYGFQMVGNGVVCAIRTGDWDWADALLVDWLSNDITGQFYLELFVDRAILTALRGADPSADIAEAERLLPGISDTQFTSYVHWARAWSFALCRAARRRRSLGEHRGRRDEAISARWPRPLLPAPHSGRATLRPRPSRDRRMDTSVYRGQAVALDLATIRAGIAALEGRRADAVAGYRDVLRGWRAAGLPFDEALASVDMATVLGPVRAGDAGGGDGHRRGAIDPDPVAGETVPRAPRRRRAARSADRPSRVATERPRDRTDDGRPRPA